MGMKNSRHCREDNAVLLKYGNYGFRVLDAYKKTGNKYNLIIAVIYTGDVKTAPNLLDRGSIRIKVKQVFLPAFDGEAIFDDLSRKVENKEPLSDEDIIRFVTLPLIKKAGDQKMMEETINLAKQIDDERMVNHDPSGTFI